MSEPIRRSGEFGSQPGDIDQFVGVIKEINEHNQQFSMGAAMAGLFKRHIEVMDKAGELQEAGVPEQEAQATAEWLNDDSLSEQQKIDRMILGTTNAPILEKVGLGLSPTRPEFHIASSAGVESLGPVRNQIKDGALFVEFLGAIPEESSSDTLKDILSGVVTGAAQEAYTVIGNAEADSSVATEALAYADGIGREMDRLGIPRNEVLATLAEYSRQGIVREYVQADRSGIFQEVGGRTFAPSEWHQDATSDYLASHWDQLLGSIKSAKANPKAARFTADLIDRANEHLAYAKTDWAQMKKDFPSDSPYGKGFNEIFDHVAIELVELAEA